MATVRLTCKSVVVTPAHSRTARMDGAAFAVDCSTRASISLAGVRGPSKLFVSRDETVAQCPIVPSPFQAPNRQSCRTASPGISTRLHARRRMFDDPFNYGEDPEMEFGDLMATGKQSATVPRPPTDETSKDGFLTFPRGHNIEIASLGLYVRGDVRKCALLVAGGVYENLLFFPVIQLLKEKYPGVSIDVVATARGKQAYEMNKNVRRAWVYDVEDVQVVPADYMDMLGKLKNECYDLVLSTRPAGIGHAMMLFLTDARQRVAYVPSTANGAGAGPFLSKSLIAEGDLAEGGYSMYSALTDFLRQPSRGVPMLDIPPLEVGIGRRVRDVTEGAMHAGGVEGEFVIIHGVESSSAASMRSRGDTESQLSVEAVAKLAEEIKSPSVVVVISNDKDRAKVAAAVGPTVKILKISTPGQLGALIESSAGVVASNTAALLLAMALKKPSVGLFASPEKATLYAPLAKESKCAVVSAKTGKLADIDFKAVNMALTTLK